MGKVAVQLEDLPEMYHWYEKGGEYFFTSDNRLTGYFVDVAGKRVVKKPLTDAELGAARKVEYDFDPGEYADCTCSKADSERLGSTAVLK